MKTEINKHYLEIIKALKKNFNYPYPDNLTEISTIYRKQRLLPEFHDITSGIFDMLLYIVFASNPSQHEWRQIITQSWPENNYYCNHIHLGIPGDPVKNSIYSLISYIQLLDVVRIPGWE